MLGRVGGLNVSDTGIHVLSLFRGNFPAHSHFWFNSGEFCLFLLLFSALFFSFSLFKFLFSLKAG